MLPYDGKFNISVSNNYFTLETACPEMQYSKIFCTFLHNFLGENFNFSENNIISLESAKVLWMYNISLAIKFIKFVYCNNVHVHVLWLYFNDIEEVHV